MRIAVACDGLETAPSLVRCTSYMCYAIEGEVPVDSRNIPVMDASPGSAIALLRAVDADVVLANRVDEETATMLQNHSIAFAQTLSSDPLTAVREYLETIYV